MRIRRVDTPLLVSILALVTAGFLIFLSASLGLLARDQAHMSSIAWKQVTIGLLPGLVALWAFSRLDYLRLRTWSFWAFLAAIVLNLIIFIPGLGLSHGGATRWLLVGSFSFQVSEALKITAVICFAAWLSLVGERIKDWRRGLVPLCVMLVVVGILCLLQPDTDTLAVISCSIVAMYLVAGGKWKHIFAVGAIGLVALAALAVWRPYVRARIETFIHPAEKSQTSGYQIEQSLIAIGSGQITGRGFGQSIQKFAYLPEPVGDSIFAVAAEEFGLIGSITLIGLYVFFALRTFRIAARASDPFGSLLATGIATFVIAQSFVNIGAMAGVLPLSGIPLLFVSQGGTALFFVLAECGMLLNISRTAKR
ncbi:MAG TPA: putative peptidoglycan glycosyltransferase FtsW [Candidatus Paceibacterota bacterium]